MCVPLCLSAVNFSAKIQLDEIYKIFIRFIIAVNRRSRRRFILDLQFADPSAQPRQS